MPKFGTRSRNALKSCDKRIQLVFNEVITTVDCSVLEGHRGQVEQDKAYKEGKSKVKYPKGRHNQLPSRAADVVPYPIDWNDRERFTLFAGFVLGTAQQMGINLRWGGDWDKDWYVHDNMFDDFPHFELLDVPGNDKA
jgi:hypothetical protein